ncbi:MAG: pilin [Patescibacteria group bacterium]
MRSFIISILTFSLLLNFSLSVTTTSAAVDCQIDPNDPKSVCLLQPDIVPEAGKTESSLPHYLSLLFKTLIGLAGGIAVLFIVIGGLQYIFSEVPGVKSSGKERISNALVGLILALAAYLILYTINPDLINLNLKLKQLKPSSQDPTSQDPNLIIIGSEG